MIQIYLTERENPLRFREQALLVENTGFNAVERKKGGGKENGKVANT